MPYLLKSEPEKYSFDDLVREGETVWDGIRNAQALNTLAAMRKGERLVIYHSQTGKEVVGLASVVSVDPADKKNPIMRIKAGRRLKTPVPLAAMRDAAVFRDSPLFRQFRLSVVPLTDEQYDFIVGSDKHA